MANEANLKPFGPDNPPPPNRGRPKGSKSRSTLLKKWLDTPTKGNNGEKITVEDEAVIYCLTSWSERITKRKGPAKRQPSSFRHAASSQIAFKPYFASFASLLWLRFRPGQCLTAASLSAPAQRTKALVEMLTKSGFRHLSHSCYPPQNWLRQC